jgi:hypothetical protein
MSAFPQAVRSFDRNRKWLAIVAAGILCAVTITGCATFGDYSSANPEPKPKPQVVEDDTPFAQKVAETFLGILGAVARSGYGGQVSL